MTPTNKLKPCKVCDNTGWVCEKHPKKPFEHKIIFNTLECSVPGMPCKCNKAEPPWNFKERTP